METAEREEVEEGGEAGLQGGVCMTDGCNSSLTIYSVCEGLTSLGFTHTHRLTDRNRNTLFVGLVNVTASLYCRACACVSRSL